MDHMPPPIPEDRIRAFLQGIEDGTVKLTWIPSEVAKHQDIKNPRDDWSGNITYRSDKGWEIVIFNDCGVIDYIDSIRRGGKFCNHSQLDAMLGHYNFGPNARKALGFSKEDK